MTNELVNIDILKTLQELDDVVNIPLYDELSTYLQGVRDVLNIVFNKEYIDIDESKDNIIENVEDACPKYFAIQKINELGQKLVNTPKKQKAQRKELAQSIKYQAGLAIIPDIDVNYGASGYIALADLVIDDEDE